MRSERVSITPDPRLMQLIGNTSLDTSDAIAELAANSFDAKLEGELLNIWVRIDSDNDEISVIDDGSGMEETTLIAALSLGVDMDKIIQRKANRKGFFGMGMKTACASMGDWWAIYTKAEGSDYINYVSFDLGEWQRRPKGAESWSVEVQRLKPDAVDYLNGFEHGTAIIIRKLHKRTYMSGPVLTHLSKVFKGHLKEGDKVYVDGIITPPYEDDYIIESKIDINIKHPVKPWVITGYVYIDKEIHNSGDYGFNIYRNNQLLQSWYKGEGEYEWFAPHLMTSRIAGEVHLDFIEANFFKKGIETNEAWEFVCTKMKDFLRPVVAASRYISKDKTRSTEEKSKIAINKMRKDMGLPLINGNANGSRKDTNEIITSVYEPEPDLSDEDDSENSSELPEVIGIDRIMTAKNKPLNIICIEHDLKDDTTCWSNIYIEEKDELQIVINPQSEYFKKQNLNGKEIIKVLAKADGIKDVLIKEKMNIDEVNKFIMKWIKSTSQVREES